MLTELQCRLLSWLIVIWFGEAWSLPVGWVKYGCWLAL